MVEVSVNEEKFDVEESSTIRDAIEAVGGPYAEECKTIVMERKEIELATAREFWIETPKGRASVKIDEPLFPVWSEFHRDFESTDLGWVTKDVVAFGPVDLTSTDFESSDERQEYRSGAVFLGFGGYDTSQGYLCFSRTNHEGVYGAPEENEGIIGRVMSGRGVIGDLGRGDEISRIYPLTRKEEELSVSEPEDIESERVKEGLQILTCIESSLVEEAPQGAERFMEIFKDEPFHVCAVSSTFICDDRSVGAHLREENTVYRPKGSITIRNDGRKGGAFYIYRKDVPFTTSHSVIGRVTKCIELVEQADLGDKILVKTKPRNLRVVGMSQKEASGRLSKRGIKHIRVENKSDDAIIVEQRPNLTMEAKKVGSVATLAVDPELISRIEIWDDESPESASYFRRLAGLVRSPIGKFDVYAKSDELLLLSGPLSGEFDKPIPVEKRPSDLVEEGIIGVTNIRRRTVGSVGIRLKESEAYGPTGEVFDATNLIGRVTKGLDFIKGRDVRSLIYLREEGNE